MIPQDNPCSIPVDYCPSSIDYRRSIRKRCSLFLIGPFIVLCAVSIAVAQKPYRGAEYRTINAVQYGRFEVRMRSAQVSGMLSSFFTYYEPASPWNEIDVETMGRYSNEIQFNTIVPADGSNHVQRQVVPFNPHAAFHVIGFEWTPDYVAWQVDGEELYRQTGSHIALLTKQQKIMMNIWQPTDVGWAGEFSSSALPVYAYYDWVKYYAYTPGAGDNFTLLWTDNFTTFDSTRWQKATHTWSTNNAQFVTENAVIQGGYLILCLTSNTSSGYSGGAVVDQDVDAPYVVWARGYDSTVVVRFSEAVDQESAETIPNYVSSHTVKGAALRTDGRTVDLAVSGPITGSSFPLFVQNIRDKAPAANTMGLQNVRVKVMLPLPISIDVGGNGSSSSIADSVWSEQKEYGGIGGTWLQLPQSTAIAGTTEPDIYRTIVHGISGYKVRVPNGTYRVTLKMVEDTYASSGMRLISAKVQGVPLFTNLDLYSRAGLLTAFDTAATSVVVDNNVLVVWMGATVDSTTLSGLVIERLSGPTGFRPQPDRSPDWGFSLYPNPLNGSAVVRFTLPASGLVTLQIHDTLGREVEKLFLGVLSPGLHEYRWRNDAISSGIYFLSLRGGDRIATRKVVVMR